jgi:predicted dehydrogenase
MSAEPVKIGFVGAGWWATANHIPRVKANPRAALAGVCRLGAAELDLVRRTFDFPYATEDFSRLLDEVRMDGLVISSPHRLHATHALAAMERGIHVLIEKPLATDPAEARAVVAAARANGVHALVPYGWNFKPFFATARRWLAEGRLGTIRHVAARMASPIADLMTGGQMPGTEGELFRPDPGMWADPVTGGYGYGQLVHLLGALFYIADELRPVAVFAATGDGPNGGDIYDAAIVRFANGATAAVSGAATLPQGVPFDVSLEMYGSEGVLSLQVAPARLELRLFDGTVEAVPLSPDAGAYECLEPVDRFVALCAGDAVENAGPVEAAARAVEVVAAMLKSARRGVVATIGEVDVG